jgi:hypothetical protein
MIAQLQATYDHAGVFKQMLADLDVARELDRGYRNWKLFHPDSSQINHFQSSFKVLSQADWPLHLPKQKFRTPESLGAVCASFTKFFAEQRPGRTLLWMWHLSHGELQYGQFRLSLTAYQMAILLLFNDVCGLPLSQIEEFIGIETKILHVLLDYFVKTRLLLCQETNEIKSYFINEQFKSKRTKVDFRGNSRAQKHAELQESRKRIKDGQTFLLQVTCPDT